MASIREKQASRLRVLLALYEMTDGSRLKPVNYREIAERLDLDEGTTSRAVHYLVDEHLAEWAALGGMVAIEHRGIREAEAVLGGQTTYRFGAPVINIINVGSGGVVGNIQQGTTGSLQDRP